MSTRNSYFEDGLRLEQGEVDYELPSKQGDSNSINGDGVDLDLLRAQLRVAKAVQVLKRLGLARNVGIQRSDSSATDRTVTSIASSTPELAYSVSTPSEDGTTVTTPNHVEGASNIELRQAFDSACTELHRVMHELQLPDKTRGYASSIVERSSLEIPHQPPQKASVSDHEILVPTESTERQEHSASRRGSTDLERQSAEDLSQKIVRRSTVRSRSLAALSRPAREVLVRRSSLSDLSRRVALARPDFQSQTPTRDLILPTTREPAIDPAPKSSISDEEIESLSDAAAHAFGAVTSTDEPADDRVVSGNQGMQLKPNLWVRARQSLIATYAPRVPPPLVMPSGPTDIEKISYLKTQRLMLYSFGLFSFLSLSAGMWLFVVSALPFYWFGAVVVLLQAYLFVSYAVSIVGKDFDYESHQKILQDHPIQPDTAPTVDIYLPCCKEPIEVLENTYKYVQQLQYPAGKLKVYVLDDGGSAEVEALATQYGFNYICREDRPRLKKAGNLRWAFARTQGDFFTIYDADFCPRSDFLLELIPEHLANPKAAIIQTPQFFRTLDQQTWVEQGAGAVQELFYRVIQVNRNRWGASICVGSNAVYRREALAEVGGTAEIGFSEDVHTGFYALTRGWQVRYIPLCLACGICPDTPRAFFSQQMRWCMGSTTLLSNPDFWKSNLTIMQKICYLSGMMYYSALAMSIFLNPLPGLLMIWVRPDYVRFYNLAFAVPSLIYSFIAIRAWAKASYGLNVQFAMAIQNYAYLTAIKDRIFGRALAWVPSGDTKAHKNNKYRNMRILAWVWMLSCMGALFSGITYQILGGMLWYDIIPILCLTVFNFFMIHRFLLCHGKL